MIKLIETYMFSLLEPIFLYSIVGNLLSDRYRGVKKATLLLLGIFADTMTICLLSNALLEVRLLAFFIVSFLFVALLYFGDLAQKAFLLLVAIYIFIISDIITGNIVSFTVSLNIRKVLQNESVDFYFSIVSKLINLIFTVLIIKKFKSIKFTAHNKYLAFINIIIILFIITLTFIVNISSLLQEKSDIYPMYITSVSIAILVIGIFVIYIFAQICSYYEQSKDSLILRMRNISLEKRLEQHQKVVNDLQIIKHDINKNLASIASLLRSGNVEHVLNYIDSLVQAASAIDNVETLSGNKTIDAILSYEFSICKQHNINIDYKISSITKLRFEDKDLTGIIANLIDNAIEAVDLINENRHITVKIYIKDSFLIVVVKNPSKKKLNIINGRIITSKKIKESHGYGLSSVSASVSKYAGSFKYYFEDNIFTAVVILPTNI